jgi:hypothetical protein
MSVLLSCTAGCWAVHCQIAICVVHLQRTFVDEGWFSVMVASQHVLMWTKLHYFAKVFNPTKNTIVDTIRIGNRHGQPPSALLYCTVQHCCALPNMPEPGVLCGLCTIPVDVAFPPSEQRLAVVSCDS